MDKSTLIVLILLTLFVGALVYSLSRPSYPISCYDYRNIMKKISSIEEKQRLKNYVEKDIVFLDNITYERLLLYLHSKVNFCKTETEDIALNNFRKTAYNENPIGILEFGLGRCGEFTITYTALLLAYGFEARMIMCLTDHVWVELKTDEGWMHIEPSDQIIDDPFMYERDRDKNFDGMHDKVYAIESDKITDITSRYNYEENKS